MRKRKRIVPVAELDRLDKARMIEAVLVDFLGVPIRDLRVLDIGCGNGDISDYFGRHNRQSGVDVADRRRDRAHEFEFHRVDSEALPFENGVFDIVISHHVIEHVNDQGAHLGEIRRVLRPGGCAYLATPNRSSPVMKGHIGNPHVLRYPAMTQLFRQHGFAVHEYTVRMLKDPDRYALSQRHFRLLPGWLLLVLRRFIPTHVFVLQPERL